MTPPFSFARLEVRLQPITVRLFWCSEYITPPLPFARLYMYTSLFATTSFPFSRNITPPFRATLNSNVFSIEVRWPYDSRAITPPFSAELLSKRLPFRAMLTLEE